MEPTIESSVPIPPEVVLSPALRDDVLGSTYLLGDIVVSVDSPTSLVRAAAVSKFWRKVASAPASLRRFGDLHHPLLLGFYLTTYDHPATSFEKMPDLPEELAADVRRGSFNFGPHRRNVLAILDRRNGHVITGGCTAIPKGYLIHQVLRPNGGPPVELGKPPQPSRNMYKDEDEDSIVMLDQAVLLPEDGGDGQSCTAVTLVCADEKRVWVHVCPFQAPVWGQGRTSNKLDLPVQGQFVGLGLCKNFCLLTGGRAYMIGMRRQVLVLDLASMNLLQIQLPEGVEFCARKMNLRLCRAEASAGVFLVYVTGTQLHVWLHSAGDDGWTAVDTVDLRQAFGHLGNPVWLSGDAACNVLAAGDNASFVFLQVMHELFYLHVASRKVKKVFELPARIRDLYVAHRLVVKLDPVMMVWPPNFQLQTGGDGETQ